MESQTVEDFAASIMTFQFESDPMTIPTSGHRLHVLTCHISPTAGRSLGGCAGYHIFLFAVLLPRPVIGGAFLSRFPPR